MPPVPALHILQKPHCISLVQKQSHAPLWTNHCRQGTNGPNCQGWSPSTGSHGNTTWKIGIIFFKPCSYFIYVTVAWFSLCWFGVTPGGPLAVIDSLLLSKTGVSKMCCCFIIFLLLFVCVCFFRRLNMEDSLPDWSESLLVLVLLYH